MATTTPANLDPIAEIAALRDARRRLVDAYEEVLQRAIVDDRDVFDDEQATMDQLRKETRTLDARIAAKEALRDPVAEALTPQALKETPPMRTSQPVVTPLRSTAVGSPAVHTGEIRRYSVTNAIAFMFGDDKRDGLDTGLEVEFDQEMRKRGFQTRHGGFWLSYPGALDEAGYRARDISSAPGGAAQALASIEWRPDLFRLTTDALRPTLGGFKRSSQRHLCWLIEATGQVSLRVFSNQVSFGAGS
jgi:hypothetical protein